jgi:ribosome biogenesis GTPase A
MIPRIEDTDLGLKLALTNAIKDSMVPVQLVATYLLFLLNHFGSDAYVKEFALEGRTDSVNRVFEAIARKYNLRTGGELDAEKAAHMFVDKYRAGLLGKFTLDDLPEA